MAFRKIMWGTILQFDFRLNGLDILPDFVGYILIFLGLSEMIHLHKNFEVPRILAGILIIPSLFTLYQNPNIKNTNINAITITIGIIVTILYLFYAYNLYMGIKDKAIKLNNLELANNANLVWKLIVASEVIDY
jgi:hypothetical protein